MEPLARRSLLKLLFGVGAAAACGMSATNSAEAKAVTPEGTAAAVDDAAQLAGETVESEFEPNQFYFVRRRRFRRRRVFYYRPRRRIYYFRPRRRFYRVRRFRRFR